MSVEAPTFDSAAARNQGTSVITASSDSRHAASEPRDSYGNGTVIGRVVAELTVSISSPAFHVATRGQRTSVKTASSDSRHAASEPRDSYRNGTVSGRAIAELTASTNTPAFHAACGQRTGVSTSSGDSRHAASEPRDSYGNGTVSGRAITELTGIINTPAFHAACGQRTGVMDCITSSGDSRHAASEPRDSYGSGTVSGRAIAELTGIISSPTLHVATRGQRTDVRSASGDRGHAASEPSDVYGSGTLSGRAVAE